MFGLNKDTPVVGKADIKVQSPCKEVFSFVGANFIKNYPKWSPEVVDLEITNRWSCQSRNYVPSSSC